MMTHRAGWISDVHLGTRGCQAEALLEFLRDHEFETLYLVGDLIDIWSLRRRRYWPQSHSDVVQKLLRKARKGTRLIYIPGNHDEFVAEFPGDFGNIEIMPRAVHRTWDGRKILVIHGHELDTVVQNMGWLAHVGGLGYELLLQANHPVHWVRHRLGLAFNEMVASGELKAPVVIGRDHLDSGSVASPNRETEAMRDGSDAVSDWPLLNALLNTASGATWVSLHHGGGVGMGYSQHSGMVIVADGTPEAAQRLERVLWNDPGTGVMRHADAGYEIAIDCAREKGLDLPSI